MHENRSLIRFIFALLYVRTLAPWGWLAVLTLSLILGCAEDKFRTLSNPSPTHDEMMGDAPPVEPPFFSSPITVFKKNRIESGGLSAWAEPPITKGDSDQDGMTRLFSGFFAIVKGNGVGN